jgi:hypothetical protein
MAASGPRYQVKPTLLTALSPRPQRQRIKVQADASVTISPPI